MSTTRSRRLLSLGLTVLIALVSAVAALAVSGGHDAAAHGSNHGTAAPVVTQKQLAFRNDMRKLWEDHVTWTRLAIISLTTDSPDTNATVGRLLQNQVDIGDAVKPYYGEAAGDELTKLLKEHILGAVDVLMAAKSGDQNKLTLAEDAWFANGREIADFLQFPARFH